VAANASTGYPMDLLRAGVPLSLLVDLAVGVPDSDRILEIEGGDADWMPEHLPAAV
jgi:hypothetical protein